jgi:opacity protein-like surface antigen
VSQQNLGAADAKDESTYAFDVGAGFDLNISGALAIGVRYTRSFFSDDLSLTNTQNTSGHRDTFIAQLSVFF